MKRSQLFLLLAVVLLAGLFLALSWQNSLVVNSVSIRIKDGMREHNDHTLLGVGAEHQLPDYEIKMRVSRRFLALNLGTKLNTSATNWLEYPVSDLVPLRRVQEIIIIEDDKVEDDVLERIQVSGLETSGTSFMCRLGTAWSFEAGMNWFFDTSLGKAVVAGVMVGVVLLIRSVFQRR